eukprot:m.70274 g.70274  ORF g.70274 m.70274 type:complete len:554 (+) comp7869_c2_seq1:2559-4220(+)
MASCTSMRAASSSCLWVAIISARSASRRASSASLRCSSISRRWRISLLRMSYLSASSPMRSTNLETARSVSSCSSLYSESCSRMEASAASSRQSLMVNVLRGNRQVELELGSHSITQLRLRRVNDCRKEVAKASSVLLQAEQQLALGTLHKIGLKLSCRCGWKTRRLAAKLCHDAIQGRAERRLEATRRDKVGRVGVERHCALKGDLCSLGCATALSLEHAAVGRLRTNDLFRRVHGFDQHGHKGRLGLAREGLPVELHGLEHLRTNALAQGTKAAHEELRTLHKQNLGRVVGISARGRKEPDLHGLKVGLELGTDRVAHHKLRVVASLVVKKCLAHELSSLIIALGPVAEHEMEMAKRLARRVGGGVLRRGNHTRGLDERSKALQDGILLKSTLPVVEDNLGHEQERCHQRNVVGFAAVALAFAVEQGDHHLRLVAASRAATIDSCEVAQRNNVWCHLDVARTRCGEVVGGSRHLLAASDAVGQKRLARAGAAKDGRRVDVEVAAQVRGIGIVCNEHALALLKPGHHACGGSCCIATCFDSSRRWVACGRLL